MDGVEGALRLVEYRHPDIGFVLPVPDGWERVTDQHGAALITVEPPHGPWFRANAIVTAEPLPAGVDLQTWQTATVELLSATLMRFWLIDLDVDDADGRQVGRILAHHTTDVGAVTMEQWQVATHPAAGAPVGYTLTASVDTLEYDALADMFAAMASGLHPDPEYTLS